MNCLHKYQIVQETNDGLVQVCEYCKRRIVFRKNKIGQIDNERYKKEHQRDLAQKGDKNYSRIYGNGKAKKEL